MQADPDYLDRKNEEIALIARALGLPRSPRVRTIEAGIEAKFQLGAELRAKHALRSWQNTETTWQTTAALRSGPFAFTYRYQRADLRVTGPFPYGSPERLAGASLCELIYTSSGMAAISAVLLALAAPNNPTLLHLPGCYKETLEFAATCTGFRAVSLGGVKSWSAKRGHPVILWLDCLPFGESARELRDQAKIADLIIFDTTAFPAQSGCIRRFLQWAREARSPVALVRSHTKLDTLGIEYGRLGSAIFLAFPEVPIAKLKWLRQAARRISKIVRLLGSAAVPAHFCPFADGPAYWRLSARRSAAMLRNGHLAARTLTGQLGRSAVRQYRHGLFTTLVPPYTWQEGEAAQEAGQLAAWLAGGGLPVRHAGSFGFDFVTVEGFFDTAVERHLLRVGAADLPQAVSSRIADGIANWWTRRWQPQVA